MPPLARHILSAALVLSANLLPSANAEVITENFSFSGAGLPFPFTNGATATGYLTFDTAVYTANHYSLSLGDVIDLSVTVSGAASGNGTFGKADFISASIWTVTDVLDWSQPLMGPGGWTGPAGGFELVSSGAAPSMKLPDPFYILYTNGGAGSPMKLTSLVQAAPVPEPETYMLMGLASAALAYARRRKSKQAQGAAEVQPQGLLAA